MVDFKTYKNIAEYKGIAENMSLALDGKTGSITSEKPLYKNSFVNWMAKTFTPNVYQAAVEKGRAGMRDDFAKVVEQRYGPVIGQMLAENLRREAGVPLTRKEINWVIETGELQIKSFQDSNAAKKTFFSGVGDEQGLAHFSSTFNDLSEKLAAEVGLDPIDQSAFKTDSLQDKIGKFGGSAPIRDQDEKTIVENQKTSQQSQDRAEGEIKGFLYGKYAALSQVPYKKEEDKPIIEAFHDVIKNLEGVEAHSVKVIDRFSKEIAQDILKLKERGFPEKEVIAFLQGISDGAVKTIAEYTKEQPEEARKNVKVNDQDVVIGSFRVALAMVGKDAVRDLQKELGYSDLQDIVDLADGIANRNFQEFHGENRVEFPASVFVAASQLKSIHSGLLMAVDEDIGGKSLGERGGHKDKAQDVVGGMGGKNRPIERPKLADVDPGLVIDMSERLNAPGLIGMAGILIDNTN